MRTIRVPAKWANHLDNKCRASAGPNPSISGMKSLYWGKNAPVIACGSNAYLVSDEDYNFFANLY